jgi:hypothetical protein
LNHQTALTFRPPRVGWSWVITSKLERAFELGDAKQFKRAALEHADLAPLGKDIGLA